MLLPNLVFGQGTKTSLKTSVGLLITTADQDSPPHHGGVSTYSSTDSVVSFNFFFFYIFPVSLSSASISPINVDETSLQWFAGVAGSQAKATNSTFAHKCSVGTRLFQIITNTSVLPLLLWLLPLCCTIHPPQLCQ